MIPDVDNPYEREPDALDELFHDILRYHGDDVHISQLREEERVVLLTYHAMGIIDNGGFNYLFEGSFEGDPYFALTAAAFGAIGCAQAADAFRKALALFPDSRPPKDIERRLQIYRQGSGEDRHAIDREFMTAHKAIKACLARYIESHREAFAHLSAPSPKRPSKPKKVAQPVPTKHWCDDLPHWARVAFAARCARLVLPLLGPYWPNMPAENLQMLKHAIELAEHSAADGQPRPGLREAQMHAVMTAGHALMAVYGYPLEDMSGVPADGNAGALVSAIAKAAENAAEAAQALPEESASPMCSAFTYASDAASGAKADAILATIERDRDLLLRVAIRGHWTDKTRVPPLVFDAPPAEAEKAPRQKPWWKFWLKMGGKTGV
jgi:hypothetical protein